MFPSTFSRNYMPTPALNRGFGGRGRLNRDMNRMMNQMMQNMENQMDNMMATTPTPFVSPMTSPLSLAADPFAMDTFSQMDPFFSQSPLALTDEFYDPFMGGGALTPFGGGALTPFQRPLGFGGALTRTPDVFRRDPFFRQTDQLLQDMLDKARDQADNRRYQLEAKRTEKDILEPGTDNKYSHQTYERLAGTGKDGRRYEREEKLLTDSDGTKRHTVKSSIDDLVKTSTWNVPAGKDEKDIPHMITYSEPEKKELFEKCWHDNMPFSTISGVEGDVARLEEGNKARESFEKIEGGEKTSQGSAQGSAQRGRR